MIENTDTATNFLPAVVIWVEPLRGKGKLEVRRAVGSRLTKWAASLDLSLEPALLGMIEKGFP